MSAPIASEQTAAIEAARAAQLIADSRRFSTPVVLRNRDFTDPMRAISTTLAARRHDSSGVTYRDICLQATYDSHGVMLDTEAADLEIRGELLTAMITLTCSFALSELTAISVLSSLKAQIEAAAEEADPECGFFSGDIIYIIIEP